MKTEVEVELEEEYEEEKDESGGECGDDADEPSMVGSVVSSPGSGELEMRGRREWTAITSPGQIDHTPNHADHARQLQRKKSSRILRLPLRAAASRRR